MADETVNLNLRADLTQLRSELGKIPGITEGEAKKMVGALGSQLKKAESASKKTAAAMKRANDQAFGDIKKGAEKVFGGVVGDIEDVGKGLAALGPAGIAAAAGIAGIGAAGYVLTSLAAEVYSAAVSVEELDKKFQGISVPGFVRATNEATAASQNLKAATQGVGLVLDQAYLEVGNRAAPVLDDLAGIVLTGGLAAKDAYVEYLGLRDSFIDLVGPVADVAKELMPVTHLLRAGADATGEYKAQAIVLTTQLRAKAAADKNAKEIAEAAAKAERDAAKAESDREAQIRKSAAALREKQAAQEAATRAQEAATQASIRADQELYAVGDDLAADLRAEEARTAAARVALGQDISAAKEKQLKIDAANDDAYFAGLDQALADRKAAAAQTYGTLKGLADDFLAEQIAAAEGGTEAQKKAGAAAFNAQKAIATAQIMIDGFRAAGVAMASAPPPANFVLAAGVSAVYAGLALKAASAPPPKFHTGGIAPDEMTVRKNEALAVMTRQGQQAIGGPQGLAKLNRGESAGGGTTVVMQYQHKSSASFFDDSLRMSNSPLRRAVKGGRAVGHRGRG